MFSIGRNFLKSEKSFWFLFLINIFIGFVIFQVSSNIEFPDEKGYWLMGESILQGKFSSWYFLSKYYPETLRTPGYPAFLSLCQILTKSTFFPKCIQLVLYFISVFLSTRIINYIDSNILKRNVFLLILIPNVQVTYYTGYISAEILNVFLIILSLYILTFKRSNIQIVFLALICCFIFLVRPAYLFFPLVIMGYLSLKSIKQGALFILLYSLLLLPFGYWNYENHGKFKITTIEGGAGVAHLGFWAHRLPVNFMDSFYWGNIIVSDYTNPFSYTKEELIAYSKQYNAECNYIWNSISNLNSKEDSNYLKIMKKSSKGIFPLYNSRYTIARENALNKITKEHALKEPFYYFKTRLYSLFRSYVTGVNAENYFNALGLVQKAKVVYPFFVTFFFIFIGLILISFSVLRYGVSNEYIYLLLLLAWYYGLIHMFFTIQARYTIPIHLVILLLVPLMWDRSVNFLKIKTRIK